MYKFIFPDTGELRPLNFWMLNYWRKNPDHFYSEFKPYAVYGLLHDSPLSGGRVTNRESVIFLEDIMRQILEDFKQFNIQYRFVFTQRIVTDELLYDFWFNLQLKIAEDYDSGVIVASDKVENYIRKKYPKLHIISSTTKLTSEEEYNKLLTKDYEAVVLNTQQNFTYKNFVPKELRSKVEILINDCCPPFCVSRTMCYYGSAAANRGKYIAEYIGCKNCSKNTAGKSKDPYEYHEKIKGYLQHYTVEDVIDAHNNGIEMFKFTGRETSIFYNLLEYAYYLVKPEYKMDFFIQGSIATGIINTGDK